MPDISSPCSSFHLPPPAFSLSASTKSETVSLPMSSSHEDWLEEQRRAVNADKKKRQTDWVQAMKGTAGCRVGETSPVKVGEIKFQDASIGLILMVNEAAKYQYRRTIQQYYQHHKTDAENDEIKNKDNILGSPKARLDFSEAMNKWDKLRMDIVEVLEIHHRCRTAVESGEVSLDGPDSVRAELEVTSPKQIIKKLSNKDTGLYSI